MSTEHGPVAGQATLPELSAHRVDEIEAGLFAAIAADREQARRRRRRRAGWWATAGAAAVVVVVAAVVSPAVTPLVSGGDTAGVALEEPAAQIPSAPELGRAELQDAGVSGTMTDADRTVISTGSATVRVADVADAADRVGRAAAEAGGHVEAMRIGADGSIPVDPATGRFEGAIAPVPAPGAWVTVRLPADDLEPFMADLGELGEVVETAINRQDVTTETIDLTARVEATEASVERLAALMAQAQNVGDLIAAESALADRQAMLESYRQQLQWYTDQVEMSTLTVTLEPDVVPVTADPAGFGDGLLAGWHGLVAAANGVVVALGFLVPWLAVAAVAAGIVVLVVVIVRRTRRRRD